VAVEKTVSMPRTAPSPARGKVGMGVRKAVQRARELRRNPTDTERKLWHHIRDKQIENFRFRRQRPIGKYIVDFICLEANLVIKLDGGQHAEQLQYDAERTKYLTAQGLHVLRYWNNDVMQNIEGVLENIRTALMQQTPSKPLTNGNPCGTPREGKELIAPVEEVPESIRSTPSPATRGKVGMGALNISPPPPKNQNGKPK
jgi:very-short-patch-repair endonuclease